MTIIGFQLPPPPPPPPLPPLSLSLSLQPSLLYPSFYQQYDAKHETRQVWYSHGCVGEPVFVPRLGWESWKEGEEDDGYVIVQLYVPETHRTEFAILDARRVDQGPIAQIKLKHHIPYGFHGTFTPEVFLEGHHVVKSSL